MANDLIEIAFVRDEPQAAMIQALLKENGIPSLQQQIGPSGPQLGYGLLNPGGGQRRVMVHAVGGYARMYFWGFGLMALAFGLFLLLRAL